MKGEKMKYNIYNEEGVLVACDEDSILELLEENKYIVAYSKKDDEEAKKLREESGYEV
tara:strand:- start:204 stop:377 length:174 start_codon:yes stop_codon:yes gene_type:complete